MGSPETSYPKVNGSTKVYGIIGNPIKHSLSPNFWNGAFHFLDINAIYIPFEIGNSSQIPNSIIGLRNSGILGINVTAPYKEEASDSCDILHSPADHIGVVNTIKLTKNRIEGWNTDATALLRILEQKQKFKSATVFGNGSTSKSVVWVLSKLGLNHINIIARTQKSNFIDFTKRIFTQTLDHHTWTETNIVKAITHSDLVINTTALGRHPDDIIPGLYKSIGDSATYIDFNYLLNSDQSTIGPNIKSNIISGKELLLQQGLDSFKILTNTPITENIIRKYIFCENYIKSKT